MLISEARWKVIESIILFLQLFISLAFPKKLFEWFTARLLSKKNRAVPSPVAPDGADGRQMASSCLICISLTTILNLPDTWFLWL